MRRLANSSFTFARSKASAMAATQFSSQSQLVLTEILIKMQYMMHDRFLDNFREVSLEGTAYVS